TTADKEFLANAEDKDIAHAIAINNFHTMRERARIDQERIALRRADGALLQDPGPVIWPGIAKLNIKKGVLRHIPYVKDAVVLDDDMLLQLSSDQQKFIIAQQLAKIEINAPGNRALSVAGGIAGTNLAMIANPAFALPMLAMQAFLGITAHKY